MSRIALLAALLALLAAPSADASTPGHYKEKLNHICRQFTPSLQRAKQHANTLPGVLALSGLAIAEDAMLLAVPVPAELQKPMAPLLAELQLFDRWAHHAAEAARAGHETAAFHYLLRMYHAEKHLDALFVAEGLTSCGSEQ